MAYPPFRAEKGLAKQRQFTFTLHDKGQSLQEP